MNAWMLLFLNEVSEEPIVPALSEIGYDKRNTIFDGLYDFFFFQTWGYFEPVAFLSTQFATVRESNLRWISPFYMSREELSYYFLAEALVMPLYSVV